MNRSLSDRIIALAVEVKRPIDRIEVQNWIRGYPRPNKSAAQQALDDLERRGLLRRLQGHRTRRGAASPPQYELVHRHQEVER